MRKIIFLMHVSLDGLVAGPNGEMDWIAYNDEVEQYSHDLHATTDAVIYGRTTYDMMAGYWPSVLENPDSAPGELAHAKWVKNATKYVVSRTLENPTWENTVVVRDNLAEEFTRIKQQPGQDLWLLGSPSVAQTFMQHDLIDEYRLNVNPVVLGGGKALFADLSTPKNLRLLEARTMKGGVVALRYEPIR